MLETNVAPLRDATGNIAAAIAVTRDITLQKLQNEALREREENFRVLFENAPFSVVLMNPEDLRIVGCNRLAHLQLGYTEEEFLSLNLLDIEARLSEAEIRTIGAGARQRPPAQFESRHRLKNGDVIEVAVSASPLRMNGQILVYAVFRDITAQKLLEAEREQMTERLRELTGYLQQAREEERKHIAREIHDQLGQELTGLKMQLNFLFRSGAPVQPADQRSIQEQVESAIRSVRSIATELRPEVLDSLGLTAAMEWLVQDFEARHQIPCRTQVHEFSCDERTATTVFRVGQEALTNVARHAKATAVEVRLSANQDAVRLEVIDNGVGLSSRDLQKAGHFGLVGMRERALLAGGALTLEPATPGMRLCLDLPLKSDTR